MRHYKDWLKAYMEYTAFAEAPEKYHLFCGLSTIASVLERKCWIDQIKFIWIPNFFIILVGPPGLVKKSSTIDIGYELLSEISAVNLASQAGSLQAIYKRMAENSSTILLSDGSSFTHCSLTASIRELGTFLRLDERDAILSFCALWDGSKRSFDYETISRGKESIVRPFLNLIGGTTTAWLHESLDKFFIGSGLSSRTLFVYAEKPRHYSALPARSMRLAKIDVSDTRQKLLDDLYDIAQLSGEFSFTEEAEVWMENWYNAPDGIMGDVSQARYAALKLSDYLARKQTHLVKIAMCLCAAQGNEKTITEQQLKIAEAILLQAESDMASLFGHIGMADLSRHLHEMLGLVKAARQIPKNQLWRHMQNSMGDFRTFETIITSAVKAEQILLTTSANGQLLISWNGKDSPTL